MICENSFLNIRKFTKEDPFSILELRMEKFNLLEIPQQTKNKGIFSYDPELKLTITANLLDLIKINNIDMFEVKTKKNIILCSADQKFLFLNSYKPLDTATNLVFNGDQVVSFKKEKICTLSKKSALKQYETIESISYKGKGTVCDIITKNDMSYTANFFILKR